MSRSKHAKKLASIRRQNSLKKYIKGKFGVVVRAEYCVWYDPHEQNDFKDTHKLAVDKATRHLLNEMAKSVSVDVAQDMRGVCVRASINFVKGKV